MNARGKSQSVPAKPKSKPRRGKQHPLRASSFANIAQDLVRLSGDPILNQSTLPQFCHMVANIFLKEAQRIRKIVR